MGEHSDHLLEKQLEDTVQTAIADGVFPGIEILVARRKKILYHRSFGIKNPQKPEETLKRNALFDLASLTKPLATALAAMCLIDKGRLRLEDRVKRFLPEWQQPGIEAVTIKHLLTHSSGLPDWAALFQPDFDKEHGWQILQTLPLVYPTGKKTVYSCLGFIALAEIIRRISGVTLNDFCQANLYKPLGIETLMFNPKQNMPDGDFVPTGYCPLRKLELKGIVHDENAALFDGEGGNAGLFGTALDIWKLCQLFVERPLASGPAILSLQQIETMISNHNPLPLEPRGLGWDYKTGYADYWSCSDVMPAGSIGHLGFTGTSLWLDPHSGLVILLLSNRVILSREGNIPQMQALRPFLHKLIISRFYAPSVNY